MVSRAKYTRFADTYLYIHVRTHVSMRKCLQEATRDLMQRSRIIRSKYRGASRTRSFPSFRRRLPKCSECHRHVLTSTRSYL